MTDDDQGRTLNDVTLYIDSIAWRGTATAEGGTTLQFPRAGDGITDSSAVQLKMLEEPVCLLAMAVAADPTILTAIDQSSNIKKLDADGTSIEFFTPTTVADGTATRYPIALRVLLARYLASPSVTIAPLAGFSSGTGGESSFDSCDGTDRLESF